MARRDRNLRTYGRHKQRTIQADIWNSDDDKYKNVFSSSSASSISNSSNSTLNSTKDTSFNDTNRHNDVFKNVEKNTVGKRQRRNIYYGKENRRRAGLRQIGSVNYFPSSESEGSCSTAKNDHTRSTANKRVTRRALRNRNELNSNLVQTRNAYNELQKSTGKGNETTKKNSSIPNFSEFDDYSLIITIDSPDKTENFAESSDLSGKRKRPEKLKNKYSNSTPLMCENESSLYISGNVDQSSLIGENAHIQVETSTPFAKRTCKAVVDISHIEPVDCTPDSFHTQNRPKFSIDDQSDNSLHNANSFVSVTSSPVLESKFADKQLQRSTSNNHVNDAASAQCLVQLDRLRESFLMMHINGRKSRQTERSSEVIKMSLNHSESLFSSLEVSVPLISDVDLENSAHELSKSLESKTSESDSFEESDDDTDEVEIENLSEIQEEDELDQESEQMENTKYELNEDYQGNWPNSESTASTESDLDADSGSSSKSIYCTAESDSYNPSVDASSFYTANHSPADYSEIDHSSRRKSAACVVKTSHHQDVLNLEKSFREILTPVKVNCEDVPQSPHKKVLDVCDQQKPLPFSTCIPADMMAECVKIGEGVYGEVYRTQNSGSVALKIIPIEGDFDVNDEPQKSYAEILPEIVISKELSSLRYTKNCRTENFCEVKRVCCVKGKYPAKLLQEWDNFHKQKQSENDRPSVFGTEQLYIMFEFADGGKDLESCNFQSISQAYYIITQVAFSLAVAEEALQFEHRDLHWGNVLVRKTDKKQMTYDLFDRKFQIDSGKLAVSIIDFTLSRLRKDGCTVFCDLATDETLFQGEGDYQFDIYRNMQKENGNKWEPFNPHTNVLWIHYLADKLVRAKRYSSSTRDDKNLLRDFRQFLKDVLQYSSACDLVINCSFINSSVC